MENSLFFRFRPGSSVLHRANASAKIVCALVLSVASFYAPPVFSAIWFCVCIFLNAFLLRSSLKEIVSDLKPSFIYAILLIFATLILNFSQCVSSGEVSAKNVFRFNSTYIPLMIGTAASLQTSSLLYRSTSVMQLKESFSKIERFIFRKDETPLSTTISLSLSFIPEVAKIWTRLENAWRARGGAESPKKIFVLVPRFLHCALRRAFEKSL